MPACLPARCPRRARCREGDDSHRARSTLLDAAFTAPARRPWTEVRMIEVAAAARGLPADPLLRVPQQGRADPRSPAARPTATCRRRRGRPAPVGTAVTRANGPPPGGGLDAARRPAQPAGPCDPHRRPRSPPAAARPRRRAAGPRRRLPHPRPPRPRAQEIARACDAVIRLTVSTFSPRRPPTRTRASGRPDSSGAYRRGPGIDGTSGHRVAWVVRAHRARRARASGRSGSPGTTRGPRRPRGAHVKHT
jgi:hypothetical protein